MKRQQVRKMNIPDAPGVYIFRDYRKRPIYIGRATSLKDRVRSYFSDDLIEARGPRLVDMVTKSRSVTWQTTDSVLEAVILESRLIKKYQPNYNVDERDDKSGQYVVITDELWPRVFLVRARDFDQHLGSSAPSHNSGYGKILKFFGPYPQGALIRDALGILRKIFPFKDEKARDPRHDSFYRSLGRSPDMSGEDSRKRYLSTIRNLIMFFEGNKERLRSKIVKEMNVAIKNMRFEDANESKHLLYALDHINDIALIKGNDRLLGSSGDKGSDFRIEAYDIAHFSGTNVVGAMVVFINGESVPSEYRKFKLSHQKNDDFAGLSEILSRRLNHSEWTYPDLIVVDGGEGQLKSALGVLGTRRVAIPVVSVVKDERHKASHFLGDLNMAEKHRETIIAANAEVHRFAISYHRLRRNKFLPRSATI